MILSHKIRLDPTVKQAEFLIRACGVSRYTWNWALAECERIYRETGAHADINALQRRWTKEKPRWVLEYPRKCNQRPFLHLMKAYAKFFKGTGDKPRFKKKSSGRDSFYIPNERLNITSTHFNIPILGSVRIVEPLRFDGKVMSATVSRLADKWFASFAVDVGDRKSASLGDTMVGVDLGIKTTAVLSNGQTYSSPKPLIGLSKLLGMAQRIFTRRVTNTTIQACRSNVVKSDSNRKAKARLKVQKLHMRIANQRTDFTHKLTTRLCRENQTVVIEDLNVAGMLKNHKLAKAISDVHFGEFRRQLEYKAKLFGTTIVIADRWFPSSKTCSECGNVKSSLGLKERSYECDHCGVTIDRDLNAAKNLCTLGLRGNNARGPSRLDGLKRELRTAESRDVHVPSRPQS